MAVKVISNQIPRQVNCRQCGARLEYVYTDIKSQDLGDGDYSVYILCPECKGYITVTRK